jgi:hypothetical protein
MFPQAARVCAFAAALALVLMTQLGLGANATDFTFNWTGTPSSPLAWNPSTGFDLVKHDRDLTQTWSQPYPMEAQHGSKCEPFQGIGVGGTHTVTEYQDMAFICNNHLMTGVRGEGYGEVTFTPAVMLDWSGGTAKATWKVSTLSTSCRDWLSFNLMPFMDNLLLTEGFDVDLAGEPRNEVYFTNGGSCRPTYHGFDVRNFAQSDLGSTETAVSDVVSPSASTRTTFQLDVSRTHVRLSLPDQGVSLVDSDLKSPLPYTQAVLQFEQHSYTPEKECTPTPTFCHANTWHWSDLSYSPMVPFSILRADRFQVSAAAPTVHFPAPAPPNSFLRMEALALPGSMKVSPDGGQSWIPISKAQPSTKNPTGQFTDQHFNNIFIPVPAGTQTLTFAGTDVWVPWIGRNMSLWSTTASPLPTPGPSGSPTPKPGPTPVPIHNAKCTVMLKGKNVKGSCTGSFVPAA